MARKNSPVLISWLISDRNDNGMQRIARRRILTRGCQLNNNVTVELLVERLLGKLHLALSFYEKGAQKSKELLLEGTIADGDLPSVILTRQAMSDLVHGPSNKVVLELVAAALSKRCTLLIAMEEKGGQLGIQILLRIGNNVLSVRCPHSELPNYLEPTKSLSDVRSNDGVINP